MVARGSSGVIGNCKDERKKGKRRKDPLDATTPFQRWVH